MTNPIYYRLSSYKVTRIGQVGFISDDSIPRWLIYIVGRVLYGKKSRRGEIVLINVGFININDI